MYTIYGKCIRISPLNCIEKYEIKNFLYLIVFHTRKKELFLSNVRSQIHTQICFPPLSCQFRKEKKFEILKHDFLIFPSLVISSLSSCSCSYFFSSFLLSHNFLSSFFLFSPRKKCLQNLYSS